MSLIKQEQINILKSIEAASGEPLISKLTEMFESEFPTNIGCLKSSIVQNDLEGLFAHAHKLKSSCLNLGATKMGEICQKIEVNAREHNKMDYISLVSELELQFPQVIEELKNYKC